MLTTKLVVRVLDAGGELLGWTEVLAQIRGDGCLWAPSPLSAVTITSDGTPHEVSVHWADVNVETRSPAPPPPRAMRAGDVLRLEWPGPIMRIGPMPVALPPVTVGRSVAVGVPTGAVGART